MNRIEQTLAALAKKGEKAFVAYITAGDPDLAGTAAYCRALAEGGAHIIELGVPFSDPIADGPTNQKAAERALASGTTLPKVMAMTRQLRAEGFQTPILLYSYANPLFKMGFATIAQEATANGIDGILCVDMPPEEANSGAAPFAKGSLATVFLASPTTADERLALIDQSSRGFVYYVSRTGVTGVQAALATHLEQDLARIKRVVTKPILVGFGINTAEQVHEVSRLADGVIVGSAIVQRIAERHAEGRRAVRPEDAAFVRDFVASLVVGLRRR